MSEELISEKSEAPLKVRVEEDHVVDETAFEYDQEEVLNPEDHYAD